jgi:RNA polymerase sigma-70 factor (sigma-E family)
MQFEDFATAHLPELLRYATALTGNADVARDVVQEALTRALVRWKRVAMADHPYAYVRTMVTNEFLSQLRRKTPLTLPLTYEALNGPRAPAGIDSVARTDERLDLRQAIVALPPKQRAVIVLRYYEGLSDNEIAETLGCRPVTVRGYAHRALTALRVDLNELTTNGERSQP